MKVKREKREKRRNREINETDNEGENAVLCLL
jgi:hypothetical protein